MTKAFLAFSCTIGALIALLFGLAVSGYNPGRDMVVLTSASAASDSSGSLDPEYVGSKKCRICHIKIYKSWLTTDHARARFALKALEADSALCLGCHFNPPDDNSGPLGGVGCEACHGPGSEYRRMLVMKDRQMAIDNGLILPTEATCLRCHNDACPHFDGSVFDISLTDGVHVMTSVPDGN